ncbi:hypothetical protein DL93DRAFT_2170308 [Clavulina sp. PMI_390]|nr:hypothetical protein DL93DRAFT_2170308 [Clavulina sp. PMI_390]
MSSNMIFPSAGKQALSAVIHFLGTAVLSVCLARRVAFEDLNTLRGWKNLTVARLSLILVFAFSLAFMMSTGILIHGVGLEDTITSCSLAIWSCILLYTTTKLLIYIFLSERVWMVWSNLSATKAALQSVQAQNRNTLAQPNPPATPKTPSEWRTAVSKRFRNPVSVVCLISLVGYGVVIFLLLASRIAEFRTQDGSCVIGLGRVGSIPLLTYDAYITVLLTALFVWPLRFKKGMSDGLRRLTTRTLIASFAALSTSTVNITVLTVLHGKELGWVMLNALVLDFVTETRLKKLVVSRSERLRGKGPNATDSFPSSGQAVTPKVHFSTAAPRPPRPSQLGGSLGVSPHSGTTHSVDFRSEGDDLDIKPSSLDADKMRYPPTSRPVFHRGDDAAHVDSWHVHQTEANRDIERDAGRYTFPSPLSDSQSPFTPHPSVAVKSRLLALKDILDETPGSVASPAYTPKQRQSTEQRKVDFVDDDISLEEFELAAMPRGEDTKIAPQGSSPPRALSPLSEDAPDSLQREPSLSRTTSSSSSAVVTLPPPMRSPIAKAFRPGSQSKNLNASISLPRPMKTLVIVTSTSETTIDA